MRQPQEVTITWMPYPENKPNQYDGTYLIECGFSNLGSLCFTTITKGYWDGINWLDSDANDLVSPDTFVIAFAEFPQGYKEDK